MAGGGGCLAFVLVAVTIAVASATNQAVSPDFSYSGPGISKWGGLCSTRKDQSPVDIVKKQAVKNKMLGPLAQNYRVGNGTLINYGQFIRVLPLGDLGTLVIDGKTYNLKHFDWHTPSEHRIDGVQYPAELHVYHQAMDGSIAIVAVLYNLGNADHFVTQVSNHLNEMAREVCRPTEESHFPLETFDPNLLRRKSRKYYRYLGSTTTPPCTGTVTWTILNKVRSISKQQVDALRAPLKSDCKNNNRPVQPLNGRQIQFFNQKDS